MSTDRRTGRRLAAAFWLARMSLLVLAGRASVDVARVSDDQHRADHRYKVGRRLDVVLGGSTDAESGQPGFVVVRQDDDLAPFSAARRTVPDDVDTASTPIADAPVPAEAGHLLGVRRVGSTSAMRTTTSTLVLAGLIGLLGVSGAAAFIVHSITRPVRRAVRVWHAPQEGRIDHRLRLTTRADLPDLSPALVPAGDGSCGVAPEVDADAPSPSTASEEGRTATSGTSSSRAEEPPTPAGVVSADAEHATNVPVVAPGSGETGPDGAGTSAVAARTVGGVEATITVTRQYSAEPTSVLAVIGSVVEQAQLLALDATIEAARRADTGSALGAVGAGELAHEAAEALTATSTMVASPVATSRYAAARGRALGPTTALWHAVQLDRLVAAMEGACETTVCGSLVRVSTDQSWPVAARGVCPTCATLAR